jgi:hypothetical protein
MTATIRAYLLSSGLCVGLLACSSASYTSGAPSPTTGGSAAASCGDLVTAENEQSARCRLGGTSSPREGAGYPRALKGCENELSAPGNAITAEQVGTCVAALRVSCDFEISACDPVYYAVGTLPNGSACGTSSQCVSSSCKRPLGSGCGTCAPAIPIGGACPFSGGGRCTKGSICTLKGGGTDGTCLALPVPLAEGETCFDGTSSLVSRCAAGLVCDSFAPKPVKCVKARIAGEPCKTQTECLTPLRCLVSTGTSEGTCTEPFPEGAACTASGACAAGGCSKTTMKCVPFEEVAAGGACNAEEKRCVRGSCRDGTCVDPIPDGAACVVASSPSSASADCDAAASCIDGICKIRDPAICK